MKLGLLVPERGRVGMRAPSGGDVYDAQLARALARRGHTVDLIGTRPERAVAALARKLFDAGYDLVLQDELGHAAYLPLNQLLRGRLPAYALVHVTAAQLEPAAHTAGSERAYLQSVQDIVFVSRHVRRETNRLLGASWRGLLLPPGSDHLPQARPGRLRSAALGSSVEPLCCLCVAHLLPHKGQLELIELFADVSPRARLLLAGDETRDRAYARRVRRAAELAGRGRVRLLGALSERSLVAAYARADVCVSASYYESYGIACAEAVAHGLPVVAWTRGGLWEFLEPGVSALRIRAGDARAFAAALSQLCESPALLARLRRGASVCAQRLPTWDATAARLEVWLRRSLRSAR